MTAQHREFTPYARRQVRIGQFRGGGVFGADKQEGIGSQDRVRFQAVDDRADVRRSLRPAAFDRRIPLSRIVVDAGRGQAVEEAFIKFHDVAQVAIYPVRRQPGRRGSELVGVDTPQQVQGLPQTPIVQVQEDRLNVGNRHKRQNTDVDWLPRYSGRLAEYSARATPFQRRHMQTSVSIANRADAPVRALAAHWPEYLMEAAALGLFLISASVFGALLEHPDSLAHQAIGNGVARRALMGLAMGATAVSIILSPWGRRSGAHMNPAVTLAFWSLGKVASWDAAFYILFQIAGGVVGMQLAWLLIGPPLGHSSVNFVVTEPGPDGWPAAFAAEFVISALLLSTVLLLSNSKTFSRWTAWAAGTLIAVFILVEGPVSGMSMNPARTLGSAVAAGEYSTLWIYFAAPTLGMIAAAQFFRLGRGLRGVHCAKLDYHSTAPCIFRCRFHEL
jgi:aquaporin Z